MKKIKIYLDSGPSLVNIIDLKKILHDRLDKDFENIKDRYSNLPSIMVKTGPHVDLLVETRELFAHGFFYSCITMCGVTAERIIKDIFISSTRIDVNGVIHGLSDDAIKEMESFDYYRIIKFIKNVGLISKETRKIAIVLLELRNKYSHARGDSSESDCLVAVKLLHKIIENTVSIFKQYDIKEGKLVKK